MIWYFTPVSEVGKLAEAYNRYGKLISNPEDWIVFQDRDVHYLTSDYFQIISENIERHKEYGMFTCLTNRVGSLSQCYGGEISENPDIKHHIEIAKQQAKQHRHEVVPCVGVISGMIMIIKKSMWDYIGGAGTRPGILGVDNYISAKVIQTGKKIGILQGLYVWHSYRIDTHIKDKSHLKTV